VLATGERLNASALRLQVLDTGLDRPRLGLVVPKRVAPRALDRNRVKRIARETFRCWRARLPARDLVVVARAGCAGMSRSELREACERLFGKLAQN